MNSPSDNNTGSSDKPLDKSADSLRKWRYFKDRLARYGVAIGGFGVIMALVLIFFYLFYEVLPLFIPATAEEKTAYSPPGGTAPSLYLSIEEQGEVGLRITADGHAIFFKAADGSIDHDVTLPLDIVPPVAAPIIVTKTPTSPSSTATGSSDVATPVTAGGTPPVAAPVARVIHRTVTQVTEVDSAGLLALGLSDGSVLLIRHTYAISYPKEGQRIIKADIEYPYGQQSLPFSEKPLTALAVRDKDDQMVMAGSNGDADLLFRGYTKASSIIDSSATLTPAQLKHLAVPAQISEIQITPQQEWLYASNKNGELAYYDIRNADSPTLLQTVNILPQGTELRALRLLAGGISLIAASSNGEILQWFPVRDDKNHYQLQRIRVFVAGKSEKSDFTSLIPEIRRRGFLSGDAAGRLNIFYSTSHRQLLHQRISDAALTHLAISPRADTLLAETKDGRLHVYNVHNPHPEVSWGALWGKVWYENYPQPDYVWQSTAASNDFEPKLSLAPLAFGSIKGAFYAMLFAVPLAILGAIYTAYFMASRMRQLVKPTIEVMQALPTVVLGFLAGLWLAPLVEDNLPGVFSLILLMPVVVVIAGFIWSQLPSSIQLRAPAGWEGALVIPIILLFGWLAFNMGRPMEVAFFGGNFPRWLDANFGISYEQRNCLIVGLAMGFAVIPTIFSIAEDAIFGVPKHLSNGSLALGATPWQTLVGVVLQTASPGIFSGIMIGLGRAVGETMIVLMATGNTPVMNFGMFSGMRTLAANVAVEMPESEVGSTHFRVLFLAGLVLLLFTFVLNTIAEMVRQRLREKYSNI